MSDWQRMIVPFASGLDTAEGSMVFTQKVGLVDALNADFGDRGAIRARRGTSLVVGSGYTRRDLDASNLPDDNFSATNLRGTGYVNPVVHTLRDRLGERAGVATRGRFYSYDGQRWQDRLGFLSARYRRLAEFNSVVGQAGVAPSWFTPWEPAVGATLGPADQDQRARLLDDAGEPASFDTLTVAWGPGRSARCGTTQLVVFPQVNTNNLIGVLRSGTAGTVTQVTLASDWKGGTAATWAATTVSRDMLPAVCCDFDETSFLVAYFTTTVNQYKLLRVSTAGSVTASATGSYGTGEKSIWITNTAVATNRAVVCLVDSVSTGCQTRIVNSTTLADQALNVDLDAGGVYVNLGHVVAGVAEGGQVWVASVNDAGTLRVSKRSTSAATSTLMFTRPGSTWGASGSQAAPAVNSMYNWGLRHQFVKVGGRVLLGLASTPALTGSRPADSGSAATSFRDASTWYSVDVTDVHQTGGAAGTGTLRDPVCVARSQEDQVFPFWPSAAVVDTAGASYRFPSSRWSSTFLSTSSAMFLVQGEEARSGLNEVALTSLRSAHHREATVFDGAVPRVLTRDAVTPVGFPWSDRPSITMAKIVGGGTLAAGSYSAQAIWACTDASGQVHRSAASGIVSLGGLALNDRLTLTASHPHLNERDHLSVYTEFYLTAVNPSGSAVHYFVGRVAYDPTAALASVTVSSVPSTTSALLYTDGNVLPATFVQGGGGTCVVGLRAWISDGQSCQGSRLARFLDEAPSWSNNQVLTVEIPGNAGRVLALVPLDDKVIAFCERGIWAFTGSGPDDLGQGGEFTEPVLLSGLGLAEARAAVYTPKGVVFQAAGTSADGLPETGGLWLLDRSLSVSQVSAQVKDFVVTGPYDMTFFPERELLVCAQSAQFGDTLVWDMREDKWARWTISPSAPNQKFENFAPVAGVLWVAGVEVFQMNRLTGKDEDADAVQVDLVSQVITDHIPIAGDQLAWGRCRSVTLLGPAVTTPFSCAMTVKLDEVGTSMSHNLGSLPTTLGTSAWPANRLAPEQFLIQQKCSVLQVTITAFAGPLNVSGLELKVRSLGDSRRGPDRGSLT